MRSDVVFFGVLLFSRSELSAAAPRVRARPPVRHCELVKQASFSPCVLNRSFGCDPAGGSMWVANCRGTFECGSSTVDCGYPPGKPAYNCSCIASLYNPATTSSPQPHEWLAATRSTFASSANGSGSHQHRNANGQCTLLERASHSRCVRNRSFGCDPAGGTMWVKNCRGTFECGSSTVHCGYPPGRPAYNCSCDLSTYKYACGGEGADYFPPVDVNPSFPKWMDALCPEVVAHFTRFPYFAALRPNVSTSTTASAARTTCTMKLVSALAASVGHTAYAYAGSHLGGLLHAGPIPWDDDADMAMLHGARDAFVAAVRAYSAPDEAFRLRISLEHPNCLKVWIEDGSERTVRFTPPSAFVRRLGWGGVWGWPFVDVFFLEAAGGLVYEVNAHSGVRREQVFDQRDFFPARLGYFGGTLIDFPGDGVARRRYDFTKCYTGQWLHVRETESNTKRQVDCCAMKASFLFAKAPCVYERNGVEHVLCGSRSSERTPFMAAAEEWLDARRRTKYYHMAPSEALRWHHPLLDQVDASNALAPPGTSANKKGRLRVVVANIERGTRASGWLQTLKALDPDVVLMNEADYGMARSANRHVARVLASELEMNYAWAIEFVELTPGTKSEALATRGIGDAQCFTGNAILSKFALFDPHIVRDPLGPYFDRRANRVNAAGHERRLGGRMGLFAKISVPGTESPIVLGNVHTVGQFNVSSNAAAIRAYVGAHPAIVAGDQKSRSCREWGLRPATTSANSTYPASCRTHGRMRGDVACTNVAGYGGERVGLPCSRLGSIETVLGDHAYIVQEFDLG